MKISEVTRVECTDKYNDETVKGWLVQGEIRESIKGIKTLLENIERFDDIDESIRSVYEKGEIDRLIKDINNLVEVLVYGRRVCNYIENRHKWYRLTKDVELEFTFVGKDIYGNETNEEYTEVEVLKRGSYVKDLCICLVTKDEFFNGVANIPLEAVEALEEDIEYDTNEDGNEYVIEYQETIQNYVFTPHQIYSDSTIYR